MDAFTVYSIIHGIEGDETVIVGSCELIVQATLAADHAHDDHPARSIWIVNNATGKTHCQWVGIEAIGPFELGDEVYIHNPGGIEDGEIGAVDQVDGDRYRVCGSWWQANELSPAATKSFYYSELG